MPDSVLDPELDAGLDEAKKKPRFFAVITKGQTIVKMIVQKKRIKDGDIASAKREFKGGEYITGVCTRTGAQLVLQVQLEEPILKPIKIKEFINEQTGATLKPEWQVVTQFAEVPDGEDTPDGSQIEAIRKALKEAKGKILQAVVAGPQYKDQIMGLVATVKGHLDAPEDQSTPAMASFRELVALLAKALGGGAETAPEAPANPAVETALADWRASRQAALAQLDKLAAAIKGFEHPQSEEAFVMVKAVSGNLTAEPKSLQTVGELEDYLQSDDVVIDVEEPNGFGIEINVRQPLLAALSKLKPLLSA